MFRARFAEAFPKSLANFGPQELERDVVETIPGERVEHFLCALLSLLLNRKQDVKYVLTVLVRKMVGYSNLGWAPGLGITIVRSKKLSRHTRDNGRRTGRARTRSRDKRPLHR